jgi:hypothetical protein
MSTPPAGGPEFVKIDLGAVRAAGSLRLGQVLVAALLAYRPEATTADLAAWLGIGERQARRWRAGAEGRWRPGRQGRTPPGADARDRTPASAARTPVTAPADARDRALHISENGKAEGERGAPPPLSLRDEMKKASGKATEILVAGYLARSIRRVAHHEAAACILDELRGGAYRPEDLAGYLDATPHVRAWPRQLAEAVGAWLNMLHVAAARREKLVAWSAWRRRLALLAVGDPLWLAESPEIAWHVVAVDAEAGTLLVARRDSSGQRYERPVRTPAEGAAWTFEAEALPLLCQGERKANGETAHGEGEKSAKVPPLRSGSSA